MQEAHTRSANRALVQMRINSVVLAPELEPTSDARERASRAIIQCWRSLFSWHVLGSRRIETLACEFIHAYPLARNVKTPRNGTLLSAPGVRKGVDGANAPW